MIVTLVNTQEVLDGLPRKRRKLEAPQPRERVSVLERLPLEILEHIFVESKNVRLLHVSRRLSRLLSSRHVRKQLITRCFRAHGLIQDVYDTMPDYDPFLMPKSQETSTLEPECYQDAFMDICLLLREEWVTMDLMKEVVIEFISAAASDEIHKFIATRMQSINPEADFAAAFSRMRRVLDKCTSPMTPEDIKMFADCIKEFGPKCEWCHFRHNVDDWVFTYPSTKDPVFLRMAFLEDPWRGKTALGWMRVGTIKQIAPTVVSTAVEKNTTKHPAPSEEPEAAEKDTEAAVVALRATTCIIGVRDATFMPWTASHRLIPPRLLAGPWTQDRGDLLTFLWDNCASQYLDDEGFSPAQIRAAVAGVDAAMDENNHMAAYMLLNSYGSSCPALVPAVADLGSASSEDTRADAWRKLSGTQMPVRGLGIPALPLTTEQLRRAIDDFDKHPAVSLLVIGHLAHPEAILPVLPNGFAAKLKAIAERQGPEEGQGDPRMAQWLENARMVYRQFAEKCAQCGKERRLKWFC